MILLLTKRFGVLRLETLSCDRRVAVVNLILGNVVLSPLTETVNPDLEPLRLSVLWPKMSLNSTKSQL